jgi:hypothetical protein
MAPWPRDVLVELFVFFKNRKEYNYVRSVTAEYHVTGEETMEIDVDGHKFLGMYDNYYSPTYIWDVNQANTDVSQVYRPY